MDLIGSLRWTHVIAVVESYLPRGRMRKLHREAGLRHVCLSDVIRVNRSGANIKDAVQTIMQRAREGDVTSSFSTAHGNTFSL